MFKLTKKNLVRKGEFTVKINMDNGQWTMNTCSDLSIEQNKPKHRSNACLMDRLLLSTPLSEHHTWSFHSNSKHFETVLLYLGFSSVIWENHIEKIDYGNQTIDFMLCLFTVDSKECDHQCSECVFSGLCHTSLNRLLARSIAPTFSFRFDFSIVTFRKIENLPSICWICE